MRGSASGRSPLGIACSTPIVCPVALLARSDRRHTHRNGPIHDCASFSFSYACRGVLGGGLWLDYNAFLKRPVSCPRRARILDIPRGTSLRGLARRMTDEGILNTPITSSPWPTGKGDQAGIKAGEFELTPA
jgi:hypothetical protein